MDTKCFAIHTPLRLTWLLASCLGSVRGETAGLRGDAVRRRARFSERAAAPHPTTRAAGQGDPIS